MLGIRERHGLGGHCDKLVSPPAKFEATAGQRTESTQELIGGLGTGAEEETWCL